MSEPTPSPGPPGLSLSDELILLLINPETGYFYQVSGWALNCAFVGAVLAELSLRSRIDTNLESLFLTDRSETGDPILDPFLKQIADDPVQRNAQYWIERLAIHAESVIDSTLARLVERKILEHHDGEFWTLAPAKRGADPLQGSPEGTADQFVKARISEAIFHQGIPDPRDAQTAPHYMADVFPDPFSFDIDRYRPERSEHRSPGYAPYGLGTHTCLGSRWMDLQLAVNVLMIAHHFTLEVSPPNFRFRFNPIPSMKPSRKLRFRIAEQHREITV